MCVCSCMCSVFVFMNVHVHVCACLCVCACIHVFVCVHMCVCRPEVKVECLLSHFPTLIFETAPGSSRFLCGVLGMTGTHCLAFYSSRSSELVWPALYQLSHPQAPSLVLNSSFSKPLLKPAPLCAWWLPPRSLATVFTALWGGLEGWRGAGFPTWLRSLVGKTPSCPQFPS